MEKLIVIYPQKRGNKDRERLDRVLQYALDGLDTEVFEDMKVLWESEGEISPEKMTKEAEPHPTFRFSGCRILFAVPLGEDGVNHEYYELLSWLRCGKKVLSGAAAGIITDADSEFFTKATAKELAVAANRAGCAFVGRPLVEGTASLDNFIVQAKNMNTNLIGAYQNAARILAEQLVSFEWKGSESPHLLVLHASNRKTSNTLEIWGKVREKLGEDVEIQEINLRNGTLMDCGGCPFETCLHFGEQGRCFYGGAIQDDVYPAVKWADGILLLCPNYNDALSANLTAFVNRLTALFRTTRFYDKVIFAIIVSGYSGSDLIAGQLITGLNMNKSFYLPPEFCMMETGNNPGTAMHSTGIEERIDKFAKNIINTLKA